MNKPIPPFGLRMPPEIKNWIEARAEENGRSMNGEIIQIIKSMMRAEQGGRNVSGQA